MSKLIKRRIEENLNLAKHCLDDEVFCQNLCDVAYKAKDILSKGGKLLFCGNGGSFSQAQHIAAELSGKFQMNRAPLDAICLAENPAYLTATANDYSFEIIFERSLEAHGKRGDLLFLLSTSGNSKNITKLVQLANKKGISTVAMTGKNGINFSNKCDFKIIVDSENTARIQEVHLLCGHIICEIVEKKLFAN